MLFQTEYTTPPVHTRKYENAKRLRDVEYPTETVEYVMELLKGIQPENTKDT